MAIEIERKFLVTGDGWRWNVARSETLRQGYLSPSASALGNAPNTCSVRVRIQGDRAFLNIKEAVMGRERLEFDYGIPVVGASDYTPGPYEPMMAIQSMVTRKDFRGRTWGANQRVTVEEALRIGT
ncbi:MAG: CYTH domain-containing protein, partial [Proteobacteria bacterium]|nr:CYTH domain-containing protein [Pseudomonadota bacterium]